MNSSVKFSGKRRSERILGRRHLSSSSNSVGTKLSTFPIDLQPIRRSRQDTQSTDEVKIIGNLFSICFSIQKAF